MKVLLLTVAAGALLAWSLPPFDQEWLGWFMLVPLLGVASTRRPGEAVGLGLLAGLVAGAIHARWHPNVSALHYAYVPFCWMALLLAGVAGAAAAARRRIAGPAWVWFVAAVAVAGEWATSFLPLPVNLALCQHRTVTVIQLAAVTGIWGVSFLLWALNALLADAWLNRDATGRSVSGRGMERGGPLWRVTAAGAGLVALALVANVSLALSGRQDALPLRVAAVQEHSGGESSGVLDPGEPAPAEGDREGLTREAVARGASLVVWSEGCLGNSFAPTDPRDETTALARELGAHLVVGYSEAGVPKGFNCAAVVTPAGEVAGVHRKIHLFLGERNAVQSGREARPVLTAFGPVGVEICFDTCYTGVTRQLARQGARLIVVPNYDPPTPRGVLHRLHAAVLPFRAVENSVPIVRADPNGCSQVIDARGRILAQGGLYRPEVVAAEVPLGAGRGTLYTRLGDWFAFLCVAFAGAGMVVLARAGSRARS